MRRVQKALNCKMTQALTNPHFPINDNNWVTRGSQIYRKVKALQVAIQIFKLCFKDVKVPPTNLFFGLFEW